MQGLEGKGAGPDGRITLQSLTSYVQREVADSSSRWIMQKQVPWLRYEGPGADSWEFGRGTARTAGNNDNEMADRLAEAEARAAREEAARKEAEQRAARSDAARKDAEAKAQAAERARVEAEEKARKADEAQKAAQSNPNDPVLAERARQSDAERRAAESRARQAEDERAKSSEAAGLLSQLMDMESRVGGMSTGQRPLFVSHGADAPYSTLAAALKDATNNAKIMVTSGHFQEDLVFTRPVTIEGDKTVLQGTLRADARVRIENCTIRGQLIPLSNFELVRCNLEIQP